MIPKQRVTRLLVLLLACLAARLSQAQESKVVWEQTGVLPAKEAVQAAAADERFVYAISSTCIAKYDRATGQRLATSTGEAEHLNSGFFWNGKLLCAHSNYPRMPERSEIKVLDPDSMRITTFKEFGNFGGSLTWVLHHDAHWWCFFARYDRHNAESFLVKFDEDWREQKRWTLPAEILPNLGPNSLSGGLWHQGRLLATDHDHPVLYQLRAPDDGSRLVLVEKQAAPFTGQGIAADLKTGALVGINRAKRLVVFAAPRMND